MRGHCFDVDGRRGIYYQVGADRYCAMVFTGGDDEWLGGDDSIWFSDLAAEDARDRHFRFRPQRRRYSDFVIDAVEVDHRHLLFFLSAGGHHLPSKHLHSSDERRDCITIMFTQ